MGSAVSLASSSSLTTAIPGLARILGGHSSKSVSADNLRIQNSDCAFQCIFVLGHDVLDA